MRLTHSYKPAKVEHIMNKTLDPSTNPGVHIRDLKPVTKPDGTKVWRGQVRAEDLPPPRTNEDAAESEASPPVRED